MSKGNKPKKPLSKKVVSLNEQLARRRGIRDLSKRFLIVCEDNKSAPNYFVELRSHFNLSASSVRVAGSGGKSQPLQVVNRAAELRKSAAEEASGTEPFDQVWCVIDGDYGTKINNARTSAKAQGIELAISTKCFEYWVLLHFEENDQSTNDCDALVSKLKKNGHLPAYGKGKCDFKSVVPNVHDASARAEKLRKPGITRADLPENQNPCSEVYKLINAIFEA